MPDCTFEYKADCTVRLPEGRYQSAFGELKISRNDRYMKITLRPSEPLGNCAAFEWYWLPDGKFDGTATELAAGVPADEEPVTVA